MTTGADLASSFEGASRLYRKADTILDVRVGTDVQGAVLRRLDGLRARLGPDAVTPRDVVIRQALADACGVTPEPRFTLRPHIIEEIQRLGDADLPRYLFYRYRYDVYPQHRIVDDFPPCVQIEPTAVCNFRCVFCYQTDTTFTRKANGHLGSMGLDLFRTVVDQLVGSVEAVTLASRGEPLVCPDIGDMLAYMSGKFLAAKLNTNASLLTEERAHAILSAGLQTVVFSADAASEPLYSKLRVNGSLEKVLRNVERFSEIKATHYPQSKLITRVSGVRVRDDQNLGDMEKLWGGLVDQVTFVDYNPWENAYKMPRNDVAQPCSDLWRRLFIWWDGRVNPCDVDYKSQLSPGNIMKNNVSSLWRGEAYAAMRQAHINGLRQTLVPCQGCAVV